MIDSMVSGESNDGVWLRLELLQQFIFVETGDLKFKRRFSITLLRSLLSLSKLSWGCFFRSSAAALF